MPAALTVAVHVIRAEHKLDLFLVRRTVAEGRQQLHKVQEVYALKLAHLGGGGRRAAGGGWHVSCVGVWRVACSMQRP